MTWIIEKRVKKLIEWHEKEDKPVHVRKLTLELGDAHSEALHRLCILEGMTKTALIRHLIALHVRALGDDLVMDEPVGLYEKFRLAEAVEN
jgi:hypothetical protein